MSLLIEGAKTELGEYVIRPEELKFAFQPIWNTRENTIYGYECLMRPYGKAPMDYINAYSRAGRLNEIEELTLLYGTQAFLDAKLPGFMFMNSFPSVCVSLELNQRMRREYQQKMKNRLVIEVLEYTRHDNFSWEIKKKALDAADINVRYAIDDFGTGTNLDVECIRKYKPDLVKIDRQFISGIDRDPEKQECVKLMVHYGHRDGIEMLAEGVETEAEYRFLKPVVDYMQGFFLGKPEIY